MADRPVAAIDALPIDWRNVHPRPSPTWRGRLPGPRAFAFFMLALAHCIVAFAIGIPLMLTDWKRCRPSHGVIRWWSRGMLAVSGVRLVVENPEKWQDSAPRLIVANHASWFDPPAIWLACPQQVRFILKKELGRLPFVGWYCALTRHYLLDRSDPRAAMAIMKRAKGDAQDLDISPVVFPEGTRSDDGTLGEMRNGSFQLALDAGIPIQPVAVLGAHAVWPRATIAPRVAGTITLRIGDPIPTEGLKGGRGRRAVGEKVRAALLALGVPDGLPPEDAPSA